MLLYHFLYQKGDVQWLFGYLLKASFYFVHSKYSTGNK